MNAEKQIEEMSCIIYAGKTIGTPCVAIANVLYDQGYCKASEVARDIFEKINTITHKYLNDKDYSAGEMIYDLEQLREKYLGKDINVSTKESETTK